MEDPTMSTTMVAREDHGAALVESVVIQGDLAKLSAAERVAYYRAVCDSLGLNPLTKPFEYLSLNNKLVLYARRDCTDQLRRVHGVSITIQAREMQEDTYVVTARAVDAKGRTDESIGAVPVAGLKGEARANALMKAETKSKRRVTLSICGLGMLDETEIESIPGAKAVPVETLDAAAPAGDGDDLTPLLEQSIAKVKGHDWRARDQKPAPRAPHDSVTSGGPPLVPEEWIEAFDQATSMSAALGLWQALVANGGPWATWDEEIRGHITAAKERAKTRLVDKG
jgi:hypothetical protein